jgi:DNA-binding SARP family transcriptional activator
VAVRLTTFAEPRFVGESGKPLAFPEKAILALVYMAIEGMPRISRSELAEFLWDAEKTDSSANLRQLLLRSKSRPLPSGEALLRSEDGDVVAAIDNVDFDFTSLLPENAPDDIRALRRRIEIQKGVFLAGVDVSSERSSQWLDSQRDRHVSALSKAVERVSGRQDFPAVAELIAEASARLLEIDAYNEVAVRALMRCHFTAGKHLQAQILFQRHTERLKDELGTRPDPQTSALAESLYPNRLRAVAHVAETAIDERLSPLGPQKSILPRVILLPPSNATGEPGNLATALIEDITVGLCRARTMAVVAHYTASLIARSPGSRGEALARHTVSYAFETRLRIQGDGFALFGGLVDVASDRYVWADKFDIGVGKLSSAYKDIVNVIVSTLTDKIERNELRQVGKHEPTAYQNYLLGQHYLRTIRLGELRRARKMFRNSLQLEPRFAHALGGLARAEHLEWLVTARGDHELLTSAERHAREAIDADAAHPSGYHQLGVVRLYNSAFDESVAALEQAVNLAPSHADLIADYADTLVHASEPERALETIERAIELNPLCPDVYWWTAAGANYCLERFDVALDCIGKMTDKSTTGRLAAACWGMLGDVKKARSFMRSTMKTYPDFSIDKWLSIMPVKENWQKEQYREGLKRAGFH